MRRFAELLAAAALGALAVAVAVHLSAGDGHSLERARGSDQSTKTVKMLDASGMTDAVSFAAREVYEVNSEPEAICPTAVPARRGYVFHCEASVEGLLVPVAVEVASPLGFYRVRSVDGTVWRPPS